MANKTKILFVGHGRSAHRLHAIASKLRKRNAEAICRLHGDVAAIGETDLSGISLLMFGTSNFSQYANIPEYYAERSVYEMAATKNIPRGVVFDLQSRSHGSYVELRDMHLAIMPPSKMCHAIPEYYRHPQNTLIFERIGETEAGRIADKILQIVTH